MQVKSNLKMKYCPMIDAFVKVREFSPQEVDDFLRNARIHDKRSYQELVVRTAIPDHDDKLVGLLEREYDFGIDPETAIEELYRMCIKVNPALNIYNVSIPVEEPCPAPAAARAASPLIAPDRIREAAGIQAALRRRVIGQDRAVERVARYVQAARLGIHDRRRPVGVFLFAGQTGVGKTELAKALAEFLTGDEANMVRVDCSEFSQPHEYSKLIGAPPGYVGYEDGGVLSDALCARPETVVLFDEVEKANAKLHHLLLQVMDEGFLTDNKGRRLDFRQAVVVLTSNVGAEEIAGLDRAAGFTRPARPDHALLERETRRALERTFRPEFLNRLDEVICFQPLDREAYRRILRRLLRDLKERLAGAGIALELSRGALEFLVDRGTDPRYGARPLKRALKTYVETPLTEQLLHGPCPAGDRIRGRLARGRIVFHRVPRGPAGGRTRRRPCHRLGEGS